MKLLDLKFNKNINLQIANNADCIFELAFNDQLENHINSFHAAAIFSLAEASSAQFLLNNFKELEGKVIPLLRATNGKYKRPAMTDIYSKAMLKNTNKEEIIFMLDNKKRALVTISVDVLDKESKLIFTGNFEWFLAFK